MEQTAQVENETLPSPESGRRYLIRASAFLLVSDIAVTVAYVTRYGADHLPKRLVRLGLWVVLLFFLLRGKSWARWLLFVLLAVGCLALFPTVFRKEAFDRENLVGTLLLLGMYLGYAIIARGLLYSSSVRAFFARE